MLSHKLDDDSTPSLGSGAIVEEVWEDGKSQRLKRTGNKTVSSGHHRTHELTAAAAAACE